MKKYLFVCIILLATLIYFFISKDNSSNFEKIKDNSLAKEMLSMNLEQTEGVGDYKQVTQSSWPTVGYKFNAKLSSCENGSELSWDDIQKRVIMIGDVQDKCYVYFDLTRFDEICDESTLACHVAKQYTEVQGENNMYYHNSLLVNGASDKSYRYAGGDYQLTDKAKNAGLNVVVNSTDTATDGVINMYCGGTKQYVGFYCESSKHFTLQYDTSNTKYTTYNLALEKAISDGYLTKDNVKNFVCFGTSESLCPTDNLYRVIGVFDGKIKLIKYDYATSDLLGTDGAYSGLSYLTSCYTGYNEGQTNTAIYYWNNSTTSNKWSESNLNKINLNTNFISNIGSDWADKIATTTWKVGGNTLNNVVLSAPNEAYQNEIVNPVSMPNYEAKIGLMYVSDYGYAANPKYWTYVIYNQDDSSKDYRLAKEANWMFMGYYDWTVTRRSDNSTYSFILHPNGIGGSRTVDYYSLSIRPVFSLKSDISFVSGAGTYSDPFRIN